MIEKLIKLAQKLKKLKIFFVITGSVCAALFIASVFAAFNFADDQVLIISLLGLLWSCLLVTLISLFQQPPPNLDLSMKFWQRLSTKITRFFYNTIGFVFIGLSITTLLITLKLASISFAG